jgi:hypothetical protein
VQFYKVLSRQKGRETSHLANVGRRDGLGQEDIMTVLEMSYVDVDILLRQSVCKKHL